MSGYEAIEERGAVAGPIVDAQIRQLVTDLFTPLAHTPREAPCGETPAEREASSRRMADQARARAEDDLRRARRAAERAFRVCPSADKCAEVAQLFGAQPV